MKKYIWAIAATIMVAGMVTFVACTKENGINADQVSMSSKSKEEKVVIAEWTDDGIKCLFDKETVLSNIQSQLKDSLNMSCIMEDLQISIVSHKFKKAPMLTVSYFDLDREEAVSLFAILECTESNHSSVMLALGSGGISASCIGVNCEEECKAQTGTTAAGELIVFGCNGCEHAADPKKSKSCDYQVINSRLSEPIFNGFVL